MMKRIVMKIYYVEQSFPSLFSVFYVCLKKDNARKASFTPCFAENRVLLPLCTLCTLESIGIKFETFN